MQTIPQRLEKVRKALGFSSWKQMGERLNYDRSYLAEVAKGKRDGGPRLERELRILEREIETGLAHDVQTIQHSVREESAFSGARSALREARVARGLSLPELAKLTKIPAAHLGDLEQGRAQMSESVWRRIHVALPDLDRDLIFSGSDSPPILDATGRSAPMGSVAPISMPKDRSVTLAPRLSDAQAGLLVEWTDDLYNYEGVPVMDLPKGKRAFSIRVRGDSMEPRFFTGDDVVALWGDELRNGQVVVAMTAKGEPLVKIYSEHDQGKKIVLTSYNSANHPPLEFRADELRWVWPVHSVNRRVN